MIRLVDSSTMVSVVVIHGLCWNFNPDGFIISLKYELKYFLTISTVPGLDDSNCVGSSPNCRYILVEQRAKVMTINFNFQGRSAPTWEAEAAKFGLGNLSAISVNYLQSNAKSKFIISSILRSLERIRSHRILIA